MLIFKRVSHWNLPDKMFFTNLKSWTKCLYLIAISKRIDLKRSAWRHFVDNKLYFHFSQIFFSFLLSDTFLIADTQLYMRLCPSVHWSVRPLVRPGSSSWKVGKPAFPPLPTRPQLVLAVYPALFSLSWNRSCPCGACVIDTKPTLFDRSPLIPFFLKVSTIILGHFMTYNMQEVKSSVKPKERNEFSLCRV